MASISKFVWRIYIMYGKIIWNYSLILTQLQVFIFIQIMKWKGLETEVKIGTSFILYKEQSFFILLISFIWDKIVFWKP